MLCNHFHFTSILNATSCYSDILAPRQSAVYSDVRNWQYLLTQASARSITCLKSILVNHRVVNTAEFIDQFSMAIWQDVMFGMHVSSFPGGFCKETQRQESSLPSYILAKH